MTELPSKQSPRHNEPTRDAPVVRSDRQAEPVSSGSITPASCRAVDANDTLLALALATPVPRLQVFAAVSWKCLVDVPVPHFQPGRAAATPVVIRLKQEERSGSVATVAWADDSGGLRILSAQGGGSLGRELLRAQLVCPAAALAWHGGGTGRAHWGLVSGDSRGEVRLWYARGSYSGTASSAAGAALISPSDSVLLAEEGSPIVQLDVAHHSLLVSSWLRSSLMRLPATIPPDDAELRPATIIGKAKRDDAMGACFLKAGPAVCPGAVMVIARPGRRLWLVGADGGVLSTLRLAGSPTIEPAPSPHALPPTAAGSSGCAVEDAGLDSATTGASTTATIVSLGRLSAVPGLGLLLSWSEGRATGHICLVDPNAVTVVSAASVAPPVWNVVCLGLVDTAAAMPSRLAPDNTAILGATWQQSSMAPPDELSQMLMVRAIVVHGSPRRMSQVHLECACPHQDPPPAVGQWPQAATPRSEERGAAPQAILDAVVETPGNDASGAERVEAAAITADGAVDANSAGQGGGERDGVPSSEGAAAMAGRQVFEAAPVSTEAFNGRAGASTLEGGARRPAIVREIAAQCAAAEEGGDEAERPTAAPPASSSPAAAAPRRPPSAPPPLQPSMPHQAVVAAAGAPLASTNGVAAGGSASLARVLSWPEGLALAVSELAAHAGGPVSCGQNCDTSAPSSGQGDGASVGGAEGALHSRMAAAVTPSLPRHALLRAWLSGGRPSSALLVLTLQGWQDGWRDGALACALASAAARLRVDQWTALFRLARHADTPQLQSTAAPSLAITTVPAAAPGSDRAGWARAPARLQANAGWRAAQLAAVDGATLLMLRAMLSAQPAAVCLGVLRGQPALVDRLPPRGYMELLRAVQQQSGLMHMGGAALGVEVAAADDGAHRTRPPRGQAPEPVGARL